METESYSYSIEHSLVHKWHIKNITSVLKCTSRNGITINSPEFSAGAKIKDSWLIRLTVSKDIYSVGDMSIYLIPKNGQREVRAKYGIYLLDNEKKKILPTSKHNFKTLYLSPKDEIFTTIQSNNSINMSASSLLQKANDFFSNDTLTIGVDLIVYDDYVGINNPINSLQDSKRKISDDFEDLLVSKRKSDIVIKVGDKNFDAHKFILTARSSVFDAMFSHNMKESKKKEVTISDIDPEVFEKLLEFIYTDKVEKLDNFADGLLEASDKYQLYGLKNICEDFLARNFTVGNALRVMILADRHNAKELKEAAIVIIIVNFTEVKKTEDYKTFQKSHPSLVAELLQKFIDNIK